MSKQITRAVRPEDLPGMLERPPRANVAFARDGTVEVVPAAFRFVEGRYVFGVQDGGPEPDDSVSLVVDDGRYYNELRGFRVQGIAAAAELPSGAPTGLRWLEAVADKVVAWHYGRMRERAG